MAKRVRRFSWVINVAAAFVLSFPLAATAFEVNTSPVTSSSQGLTELPDLASSNQIPLLDNRFRIDFDVKEITLVFFRRKGTPSVILVKPDGTKVYARTAKEHQMLWHDDKTFDLIKITAPTPGPWQAVGQILPESRIMVLTDIDLQVDTLPTDLMVGETLKVTARLTNDGKLINARDFRDILQLDVLLISTRKPEYDNHHQTVLEFTTFKDDGKNFDERARDAIFTGEFKLDIPAGEWIPKYIVKTPLYTRELMQDPIIVQRAPVSIEVQESFVAEERHLLTYQITEGPVLGSSVSLQGRIRFPSNEVQSFTLGEIADEKRVLMVANAGVGTYRIENIMFGRTKSGREFVMTLPEFSFAAVGPKIEVPEMAELPAQSPANPNTAVAPEPVPEAPPPFPLFWVIFANVMIILIGGSTIVLMVNDNARNMVKMLIAKVRPGLLLKGKNGATAVATETVKVDAAVNSSVKKPTKSAAGDDILDLSLPDD